MRTEKDQLTFFLNHENGGHFVQKNQSFFDKMQVKYAGTPVTMVITEKSHPLKELSSVALQMRRLMRAASCAGRERMLILEEFQIPGPEEQVQILPDLRIELVRLLDRRDAEAGWKYVEAMLKKERDRQADFPWSIFELAEILLGVMEDSMKELKLWDDSMEQASGGCEGKSSISVLRQAFSGSGGPDETNLGAPGPDAPGNGEPAGIGCEAVCRGALPGAGYDGGRGGLGRAEQRVFQLAL